MRAYVRTRTYYNLKVKKSYNEENTSFRYVHVHAYVKENFPSSRGINPKPKDTGRLSFVRT